MGETAYCTLVTGLRIAHTVNSLVALVCFNGNPTKTGFVFLAVTNKRFERNYYVLKKVPFPRSRLIAVFYTDYPKGYYIQ